MGTNKKKTLFEEYNKKYGTRFKLEDADENGDIGCINCGNYGNCFNCLGRFGSVLVLSELSELLELPEDHVRKTPQHLYGR